MKTIKKNRRTLAAVMFVDIIGYTGMMQKDEGRAIRIRNRKRIVLEKAVMKYHGEIIQYYGDGALVIYKNAYEAVLAAIDIQNKLTEIPRIPVRIGIHLGDVVVNSEGVYGNAVNIASRIEELSYSGGILISKEVAREIKNHPHFKTTCAGSFELKNVAHPVEIYVVIMKNETKHRTIKKVSGRWRSTVHHQMMIDLIQPYLSNINAGLIN